MTLCPYRYYEDSSVLHLNVILSGPLSDKHVGRCLFVNLPSPLPKYLKVSEHNLI